MIVKAVKYGTSCCGACKVTEDNLKKTSLIVESIDLEEEDHFITEKGIRGIPMTEFYDENDNIVQRINGLITTERLKEILK